MYTAYFDESGVHHTSSAAVVAGSLSTDDRWVDFEREWQNLLATEVVKTLHRAHLENFRGEFRRDAGWDEKRRARLLCIAHDIIKRHTIFGVGRAVVRADFEKAMPSAVRTVFGGPYGWLVQDCVVGIAHWAVDKRGAELVEYIFEAGARGRRRVEKMFEALYKEDKFRDLCRIGSWKFATSLKPCSFKRRIFWRMNFTNRWTIESWAASLGDPSGDQHSICFGWESTRHTTGMPRD
jgi:hypothetical protein